MKVSILVGGRFHAFNLAHFFQKEEVLDELVTSYPKFEVKKYGIDKRKTKSIVIKEMIMRGWKMLTGKYPFPIITSNIFDILASIIVSKKSEVYIIFSSYALYSARRIKKLNPQAIIILERSSVHIAEQDKLLKESGGKGIDKFNLNKQLKEYEEVDFIMTCSNFIKDSFIKRGVPSQKLLLNYLGVDTQEFYVLPSTKNRTKFVVGYVGAMSVRKNIKGLINAIKILLEEHKVGIELLLVGGIDQNSFNKKELEHNFITYIPPVPQKDLVNYYNQMDLFVLNSIEDGFGMVTLQAMSCGLPVIISEMAGSRELINDGENGFIVPASNDQLLAKKILWFYNNRSAGRQMGSKNRDIVSENYTWSRYGQRYLNIIKKL